MDTDERDRARHAYGESRQAMAKLEAREAALLAMKPSQVRDLQLASTQKFLETLRREIGEQESLGWPE